MRGVIWLLSGTPGAGKSTTARALCSRYPRAVHIPVDDLREFVVSGYASPLDASTEETTAQFALARAAGCRMAVSYADAGFTVVLDDVAREADMPEFSPHLAGHTLVKVLLSPRLDVAIERNRSRANKTFDTATLASFTVRLHASLLEGCLLEDGWLVVDTTDIGPEAVVDEILRRAARPT